MDIQKGNVQINGTPAEMAELLKLLCNDTAVSEPLVVEDTQVEAYNEAYGTKTKVSRQPWNDGDIMYLKLNWIKSSSRGKTPENKKIRKHNKQVAKALGRTFEGCRVQHNKL